MLRQRDESTELGIPQPVGFLILVIHEPRRDLPALHDRSDLELANNHSPVIEPSDRVLVHVLIDSTLLTAQRDQHLVNLWR